MRRLLLLAVLTLAKLGPVVGQSRRNPPPPPSPPPPSPPPAAVPASPFGVTCPRADTLYSVDGYPSSPYLSTPFTAPFAAPPVAPRRGKYCRADGHCLFSYELNVTEIQLRMFDGGVPTCRSRPGTWLLSYGGSVPAPTITVPAGHEALVRFNNRISNSVFANNSLCTDAGRAGRPTAVHFHGANSLAPFDGWAEDVICRGETKDYVLPATSGQTEWYHDHALHLTADNALHGLAGFFISSQRKTDGGCGEPYNLEGIEQRLWMLSDSVIDSQCQLYLDINAAHQDNYYGDINMINGVPFPSQIVEQKTYRFRVLNAALSRPFLLKIKNAALRDVGPSVCQIIAKEGGYRSSPVAFPAAGLLIGVAERYEVVCDFSTLGGQTLYLWNDRDESNMKAVPYFCNSHLISKIHVSAFPTLLRPAVNPAAVPVNPLCDRLFNGTELDTAKAMAAAGQYHRSFVFGRTGGQWSINGETWESAKIAADDIGQNTWEVWHLKSGGGWFHPVHMHLVELEIARRDGGGGLRPEEADTPADTIFLGPGQEIWVVVRFGAHKGDYMFHCHNLIHEDDDMLRAMTIKDAAQARGDTRASAQRFVVNPLYNLVYGNYKYADPMFNETVAKPTAAVQSLAARAQAALAANLYRIMFPLPADKAAYAPKENPWEIPVCAVP